MSLEQFLANAANEDLSVYSFSVFHAEGFSQVWFCSIDPDKNISYQGHLFTLSFDKAEAVPESMQDRVYVIHHSRPGQEKEEKQE